MPETEGDKKVNLLKTEAERDAGANDLAFRLESESSAIIARTEIAGGFAARAETGIQASIGIVARQALIPSSRERVAETSARNDLTVRLNCYIPGYFARAEKVRSHFAAGAERRVEAAVSATCSDVFNG